MYPKIEEAIAETFGERCANKSENCPCCEAWLEYDVLVDRADGSCEVLSMIAEELRAVEPNIEAVPPYSYNDVIRDAFRKYEVEQRNCLEVIRQLESELESKD